jgi:hypothetical protein
MFIYKSFLARETADYFRFSERRMEEMEYPEIFKQLIAKIKEQGGNIENYCFTFAKDIDLSRNGYEFVGVATEVQP